MKEVYFSVFPELKNDIQFKITSKKDYKYNCIAWAAFYDDRWIWPPGGYILDGVYFYWPVGIEVNEKLETFIKVFEFLGYTLCDNPEFEVSFRKIALYQDKNGDCTHAARQKRDGIWTSKLGKEHDIAHGTPYSIECDEYGKVACIMKKNNES